MLISKRRIFTVILVLLLLLAIVNCISLATGQFKIAISNIVAIILSNLHLPYDWVGSFTRDEQAVVWFIRMPRIVVGMLVGAALSITGAVMQGIFNNPLAAPGVIGVSAGAAMGAVFAISIGVASTSMYAMPIFSFLGSMFAVVLTVFLAMRNGKIPVMTLLLAGVAVGMLLGAITSAILLLLNEQQTQQYLFWMVGGLDYRRWEHVYMAFPPIMLGIIIMCAFSRHLNILALGEIEARAVGMNVTAYRLILLAIGSFTTAASVCVSGNIGFVGLVIPHMMRMLVGPDHRILLPVSAIAGALFLVFCDTLGRSILPPAEIRVGIMTALLGTPYFLYLLRKMQKRI
ncbi:MAG: iron ABC transporter permease [Phascolarctobacterium sp.]|nr:iron ABC transporter permease [Phascolarctobacterium sp.]